MSDERQPRPLQAVPALRADWHQPPRPYRWRDPARVTPRRAAELARAERADWGGCDQCGLMWHLCRCPA